MPGDRPGKQKNKLKSVEDKPKRHFLAYIVLFSDPRQIRTSSANRPNSRFPPEAEIFSRLQMLIHDF
jgi:hypothetical protein